MEAKPQVDFTERFHAALAARPTTVNWTEDRPGAWTAGGALDYCEPELGATGPAGGTPAEPSP